MKKLVTGFLVLFTFSLQAQTIFYYGNDSVSVNDFLKAYHKNNTGVKSEKAFREYLGLYIASRLKIREAKERGYDTLPQIMSDLENLRQQILPTYLNDKGATGDLVNEALARSKKDIHIAHIFISYIQNGFPDSAAAEKKLEMVQEKLKNNVSFSEVAREFSDDPSVKQNSGDLNWITVFTLPYPLENLAYNTAPGKVSSVYRSRAGYHILKNMGERPDPGRMRASQILLAYPPGSDDAMKAHVKFLADSIYKRLLKGDDFAKLATSFSNDVISAAANGQMQEFGIGDYEPQFEKIAYSLPKDGAISQPFETAYGYHIIKRNSRSAVAWNKNDQKSMQLLKNKVEQSDRMEFAKTAMAEKLLKAGWYKKAPFNEAELWSFSDSVMNYAKGLPNQSISYSTPLFQLGDKNITATDWISFAQTFRFKRDGSGVKPYPQVWDEFVDAMAIDYYQNHLENFNEEFRQQINEFRDGNLFFEIMQRQVWGPAQTDSVALADYYKKHQSQYNWTKSADAVIFYASDLASAKVFASQLKKSPFDWRALSNNFSEKIAADSGRFELSQIPNPGNVQLSKNVITSPLVNQGDKSASFALILKEYPAGGHRSFAEARGLVINDYQSQLEKSWLEELKKKYPVRVNEKVVDDIVKNRKY
jgi:peptidyl-prolyl cis-trans isomerase SurA